MVLSSAKMQNLETQVTSLPYASLLTAPLLHHNPRQLVLRHYHDSANEVEQMRADD